MLVLDTSVVSELMKEQPNPQVLAWPDRQRTHTLFLTAVTETEIRTGIAIMPDGKRQRELLAAAERAFGVFFACHETDRGPEITMYALMPAAAG